MDITKDLHWSESVCKTLESVADHTEANTGLMADRGWHQYKVLPQIIEALDVERNSTDSLAQYGVELSKNALAQRDIDPANLEVTQWGRNLVKYQAENQAMYERLKQTLDQRMQDAVSLDIEDRLQGYSNGVQDSPRMRKILAKELLLNELSGQGYSDSTFSDPDYCLALELNLNDGFNLYFSLGLEGLHRNGSGIKEAFNSITLFVARPDLQAKEIIHESRYLRFDFEAVCVTYPTPLYAPYLKFMDLKELEINLLAQAERYKIIHEDFVTALKQGLSGS